MKILYYADGRMPSDNANGYQSAQMCQSFAKTGAVVTMLISSRKQPKKGKIKDGVTACEYYGLHTPFPIIRLPSLDLIDMADGIGLAPSHLIFKLAAVLTSCSVVPALLFFLLFAKYDCFYIRSQWILFLLCLLLPKSKRKKIFFEAHSLPASKSSIFMLRWSLKSIAGTVTVTKNLKMNILALGLPEYSLQVAHDGVDLAIFSYEPNISGAKRSVGFDDARLTASYVGRFQTVSQEKGIPEIIQSAAALLNEFPHLDFYFIGGPLDRVPVYQNLIKSLGMPLHRFIFLDKQPVTDVPKFLAASDVLLMPHPWTSFYAYHVSPLKLFEYMSSGRPIVASDLPAIKEVLRDSHNALLAKPGDAGDISNKIRFLLTNPEIAARIASQARKDVQQYSWDERARHILAFICSRISLAGS